VTISVRPLRPDDDRTGFSSGVIELDRFFQRFAGQNQFRHHIGTTYVAVEKAGAILGYATASAGELVTSKVHKALAKKLPSYPLPVLRLARLAVSNAAHGRGVGARLMHAVLSIAHSMADSVGCVGVVVDAKESAVAFYERFGFFALEIVAGELGDRPAPLPMFLELGAIPRPAAE
jgi:GNAT superfamily N-acetyltransferase